MKKTYVYSRPIVKRYNYGKILSQLLAQKAEKSGNKHVCLTFDGEARTGKTSTARLTAKYLNYSFFEYGAVI